MNVKFGQLLNRIPYTFIPVIGWKYNSYKRQIKSYGASRNREDWIFRRILKMVTYAYSNIPFYKEFYDSKSFHPSCLKSFDDLKKSPIVSKDDFLGVDLEYRSKIKSSSFKATTGGSSGTPLAFYKDRSHQIKEMAFYHNEWKALGYSKDKVRMQFVGRTNKTGISYDLMRNQLRVSAYTPALSVLCALKSINSNGIVKYLHGYPSVLFDFALCCKEYPQLYEESKLQESLCGVFLNSEYPQPYQRKAIEEILNVKTIASYGHTEGAGLAFDHGDGRYIAIQAYGYLEVVEIDGAPHLVATSYDNFASPFVRYDTGDVVSDFHYDANILGEFRLDTGGRVSDYILDRKGNHLPLTGVMFGKHHRLFEFCKHIQIFQPGQGFATILYVAKDNLPQNFTPSEYFDSEGLDVDFEFIQISNPIRTKSGKVLLKLTDAGFWIDLRDY